MEQPAADPGPGTDTAIRIVPASFPEESRALIAARSQIVAAITALEVVQASVLDAQMVLDQTRATLDMVDAAIARLRAHAWRPDA